MKLKDNFVGLLNTNNDGMESKVKLILTTIDQFSLFEGEVIVAEGYNDSGQRFNVRRIIKPNIAPKHNLYSYSQLHTYKYEYQKEKAL
jgi:hypothetical protein